MIKIVHVDEPDVYGLYHELIMAVESKFKGETRHQTALRYIKESENTKLSPTKGIGIMVNKVMGTTPLPPIPYIKED